MLIPLDFKNLVKINTDIRSGWVFQDSLPVIEK